MHPNPWVDRFEKMLAVVNLSWMDSKHLEWHVSLVAFVVSCKSCAHVNMSPVSHHHQQRRMGIVLLSTNCLEFSSNCVQKKRYPAILLTKYLDGFGTPKHHVTSKLAWHFQAFNYSTSTEKVAKSLHQTTSIAIRTATFFVHTAAVWVTSTNSARSSGVAHWSAFSMTLLAYLWPGDAADGKLPPNHRVEKKPRKNPTNINSTCIFLVKKGIHHNCVFRNFLEIFKLSDNRYPCGSKCYTWHPSHQNLWFFLQDQQKLLGSSWVSTQDSDRMFFRMMFMTCWRSPGRLLCSITCCTTSVNTARVKWLVLCFWRNAAPSEL